MGSKLASSLSVTGECQRRRVLARGGRRVRPERLHQWAALYSGGVGGGGAHERMHEAVPDLRF